MHVKVQGGTVCEGDGSLCHTCRYATIVRGARLRDEIIECAFLNEGRGRVTFPVRFCTAYADRRRPSLREMEDIAWLLRTDPKRRRVGFVQANQLSLAERYVLRED